MSGGEIRTLVRRTVAFAIQRDLDGDEQLMKEVWEQMGSAAEDAVAKSEMRAIVGWLRGEDPVAAAFDMAHAMAALPEDP